MCATRKLNECHESSPPIVCRLHIYLLCALVRHNAQLRGSLKSKRINRMHNNTITTNMSIYRKREYHRRQIVSTAVHLISTTIKQNLVCVVVGTAAVAVQWYVASSTANSNLLCLFHVAVCCYVEMHSIGSCQCLGHSAEHALSNLFMYIVRLIVLNWVAWV